MVARLLSDEDGQDIVEYALLTASIGLIGIVIWPMIAAGIGIAYQEFDKDIQDLWEVPDPGSD